MPIRHKLWLYYRKLMRWWEKVKKDIDEESKP
jgi:hypothetical protein